MNAFGHGSFYFACFVTGLGVGAVGALLLAPQSGKETRRFLAQKADDGKEFVTARGRELRRQAEEYVEKGRGFVAKFA